MRVKNLAENEMSTPIQEFYRDKNIFITGATGFMGKILVEKLLYSCPDINHLYLLIRTKKNKNHEQRIQEYFEDKVFSRLDENARLKVSAISGDISKPELGLTEMQRNLLIEKIDIIFHMAATVRFDEPLNIAANINVTGTKQTIELAKEMENLTSFVYVSTAYSNCYLYCGHIQEKVYDSLIADVRKHIDYLSSRFGGYENIARDLQVSNSEASETEVSKYFIDYEKLLSSTLKSEHIEEITPMVLEKWLNTYTFSKAIAEKVIEIHSKEIPVCIFRPATVLSSYREPLPGWVDSVNGMTGVILSCAAGILRVLLCDKDNTAHLVPADMTINGIISAAWRTDKQFKKSTEGTLKDKINERPLVYNYVSYPQKPINFAQVMELSSKYNERYPTTKSVWYPVLIFQRSRILYKILAFVLHTSPAIIFDKLSWLFSKKPINLTKTYKKVDKLSNLMTSFTTTNWTFENENVQSLWQSLSYEDKKLFPFDFSSFDWDDFFHNYLFGIRHYLIKDDISTLSYAQKRLYRLKILHYVVKSLFLFILPAMIFKRIIYN